MSKNLQEQNSVDVKTAIFNTMVFDQEMLLPLLKLKVPTTVFLHRSKTFQGPLVEYEEEFNLNFVY